MDRPVAKSSGTDEHWAPDHLVLDRKVLAHAGRLLVERDDDGELVEQSPLDGMAAVEQRYPAWAMGPFGRLEPEQQIPDRPGVYALVEEGTVRYVGSARDLARFFGTRSGLGSISRRDCQNPRNEERCRLNRLVLASARSGRTIDLYVVVAGPRRRPGWAPRPREDEALVELAGQLASVDRGTWHLPT